MAGRWVPCLSTMVNPALLRSLLIHIYWLMFLTKSVEDGQCQKLLKWFSSRIKHHLDLAVILDPLCTVCRYPFVLWQVHYIKLPSLYKAFRYHYLLGCNELLICVCCILKLVYLSVFHCFLQVYLLTLSTVSNSFCLYTCTYFSGNS